MGNPTVLGSHAIVIHGPSLLALPFCIIAAIVAGTICVYSYQNVLMSTKAMCLYNYVFLKFAISLK